MHLDLRKDFADIYLYVAGRAESFDPHANDGPGGVGPITRIDAGYQFDQSGWVALIFDTRPDAKQDGEWNSHIEGNNFERSHWQAACDANEEEPLSLTLTDGTERVLPAGTYDEMAAVLGDLIKAVLLKASADGVFAGLLKASGCQLGVEEHDGNYGWAAREAGGDANLA